MWQVWKRLLRMLLLRCNKRMLLEFQIQFTGHPLLLNRSTWSLSQLQNFENSDACFNYAFGLV
ncbi:hypothetical protein MtrunA17_Chr8g0354051 [Medicago truncatula]|uniref:Uncharacterized protein n=1 Tax=Medicago truncatula TaxID=3880 RepID=A0A396GGN9_MEDTR|nr:hypothetical protein MtrunA17_Chr8g0354051 [Medicago truncatula]